MHSVPAQKRLDSWCPFLVSVVGEKDDFLYISPERLLRRRDIAPLYDNIYAFGLVLYRLFHTDSNDIELFRSGKWLLPLVDNIDTIDVSKTYYIDYVYQDYSFMKFQMPKINPNVNDTIKELIRARCSVDVQQRPDINVIIRILSIEKLHSNNQIFLPLQNHELKYYGLLSIDGGGSRGIIAAKIMEILESKIGNPMWMSFDLVGDSSTGGLLGLSLIQRRTRADELTEIYKKLSSKIFPFSRILPTTQYPCEPLEEELKNHFEDLKLTTSDPSPTLFVVTKRSTDTQPYLLRNYDVTPTDDNSFHQDCSGWLCCDAARATSAAPTYFKPFVKDGIEYTDGSVGFNTPLPERIRMDLGDETDLNKMIDLTNEYMNTDSVQADMEKLCKLIKDKQE